MPRRKMVKRKELPPDSRHSSPLVTKFVNCLMQQGKKSVAESVFYGSLDIIEKRTGQSGLQVFKQAVSNVKPVLEVRPRRVGGATYQVPMEVRHERRTALAIRWLLSNARGRNEHSMKECLASEFIAASKNEGGAIKKKEDTHRMAEANKAFAHYRW
ncbi:MAG: 30S ribosomal protein S7 [Candidatus Eisenbacteria bacterium]